MSRYSYSNEKVSYNSNEELVEKIRDIQRRATRIISIEGCIPDETNTKQWVNVYYEYGI